MNDLIKQKKRFKTEQVLLLTTLCAVGGFAFATGSTNLTLGSMATTITGSFAQVTKLITAGSYLGGIGFMVGAIMKFKQHKDNPTNVTIGQPVTLTFVAASLLFLPTLLGISGATLFGSSAETGGPTGSVFSTSS